jgi:hypothetical protein
MAWHLISSFLALLENVVMAALSLITWRVPLGNRFWRSSIFLSQNMAQSWKAISQDRKAWCSASLACAFLFSILPFVLLTHLPRRNLRRWFWHVFWDTSSLPVLHLPPASHDEIKAEQDVPENGQLWDALWTEEMAFDRQKRHVIRLTPLFKK